MFNVENYEKRSKVIKQIVFITFIVSMALALASFVMLILYNVLGVIHIETIAGTKYQNGFSYPGWQILFWGYGEMIIQGYSEYTFNIWLSMACLLPFIALIVCSIMYLKAYKVKGTNKKKAILEFIVGGLLIVGSIMLFFVDKFAIENAKHVTDSYTNYYTEYLLPALNGENYYGKTIVPALMLVVGLITGLVKIWNGLLLIYQKRYASVYKASLAKKEGN